MNYKVVYFSRTGTSNRVAKKLAIKLSCEPIEIIDNMNWNGILGFIKGGYYSLFNKDVDININGNIDTSTDFSFSLMVWQNSSCFKSFFQKNT